MDEHFWALFSDTHIAADRAVLSRGINMSEHLQNVVREVTALPSLPASVLVNGDCALNSGEQGDYATFTELLQPLRESGVPLHLTVGNHDNRENFWGAIKEAGAAPRPLTDHNVAILKTSRANWFILDSLEKTLSTPGFLGTTQLDWLAKSLDANRGKPALVMVHHQPNLTSQDDGLKDTEELMKVIRPRKQVKAHIFGHTHAWKVQRDESGIHLINLPPTAYVFAQGQPSGWVRADLKRHGARLELRCLDATHKAHGQVVDLDWRER